MSAYLAQAGMTSAYGAAGSLVVTLTWVYYSSMVFLWGAEVARSSHLVDRAWSLNHFDEKALDEDALGVEEAPEGGASA
jgi:uncharacterized BrkB/YihY/UPF0761 family membrane protein